MIQLFKTKKETTMTTKFTKHLSPLAELLTFKVQWCGKIIEQDFDNILLEYYDGKIDISSFHRNEYDENLEPEPLGFYSAPLFALRKRRIKSMIISKLIIIRLKLNITSHLLSFTLMALVICSDKIRLSRLKLSLMMY